ncbi:MAG: VanZ family protein [Planctomycetota bacterium]
MSRAAARWAAPIAWAALLLWLGRQDAGKLPSGGFWAIPGIDKVMHAGFYGVLGALTAWAARIGQPRTALLWGAAAAILVGAIDEAAQTATAGRDGSLADLLADLVGGALGAALAARLGARVIPSQKG